MGSKEKIVLKMNDGKIRVLLDTNIYISALGWSGKPKIIFEKCLSGEFELITSAEQLDELIRVMDYSKFKFTLDQKQNMLGIISSIAIFVEILMMFSPKGCARSTLEPQIEIQSCVYAFLELNAAFGCLCLTVRAFCISADKHTHTTARRGPECIASPT